MVCKQFYGILLVPCLSRSGTLQPRAGFLPGAGMLNMKNCRGFVAGLLAFFLIVIVGCTAQGGPSTEENVVIRIDDRAVTLREFNDYFESIEAGHDKEDQDRAAMHEARLQFLLNLVEEEIILKRAGELGLEISRKELDEAVGDFKKGSSGIGFEDRFLKHAVSYETWKERLKKRLLVEKVLDEELLKNMLITPAEIKAYYDMHRDEWGTGEEVRVGHILLPDEETAKKILGRINSGDDFAALARQHSVAPEAGTGGDMGYVARGQFPEVLEKAIFPLDKGAVSPVVKTAYGFHIFKVTEKRGAGIPGIEDSMNRIKDGIRREKLKAAYGPWLVGLRKRYKIEINDEII